MSDRPPSIPAATVVLFREGADGPAEHLMIERAAKMVFAAGALVFPGGRIDEDDHVLAADTAVSGSDGTADERAARIAAIREALEEVGIPIGIAPMPDAETIRRWRAALKAHQPFSGLLAEIGATLNLSLLVPFARWCPNLGEQRRFDTRFYLARADTEHEIELDADEAATHRWLTAQEAIDAANAGEKKIIFPTMRNLERLALYPRFAEARTHAATTPMQTISPEIRPIDGEDWLCIPEDAGYPTTRALWAEVIRP